MGVAALGGALAACTPAEPDHDVAYYRANPDARRAKLADCRNDRGKLAATPNCINALAADADATSQRFWTVQRPASRVQDPGKL
jgi:hypothetical protein